MEPEQQPNFLYPNDLRKTRENALITRKQLSQRCADLAAQDPTRFTEVSVRALRDLEGQTRRPRPTTAATLAAALQTDLETPIDPRVLFHSGFDSSIRNPKGNTTIPPDRNKGGRPRKT